jgi:hypothetical protein
MSRRPSLPLAIALAAVASACASKSMSVRLNTPSSCKLVVEGRPEPITLPATADLQPGRYPVELQVPEEYAQKIGAEKAFSLYGFLTVGDPTDNSRLTNVYLDVSDKLLLDAANKGRVVEAFTVDNAVSRTLVAVQLGQKKPN